MSRFGVPRAVWSRDSADCTTWINSHREEIQTDLAAKGRCDTKAPLAVAAEHLRGVMLGTSLVERSAWRAA